MKSRPSFYLDPTFSEYGEGMTVLLQTTKTMVDGRMGMFD